MSISCELTASKAINCWFIFLIIVLSLDPPFTKVPLPLNNEHFLEMELNVAPVHKLSALHKAWQLSVVLFVVLEMFVAPEYTFPGRTT